MSHNLTEQIRASIGLVNAVSLHMQTRLVSTAKCRPSLSPKHNLDLMMASVTCEDLNSMRPTRCQYCPNHYGFTCPYDSLGSFPMANDAWDLIEKARGPDSVYKGNLGRLLQDINAMLRRKYPRKTLRLKELSKDLEHWRKAYFRPEFRDIDSFFTEGRKVLINSCNPVTLLDRERNGHR